MRLLSIYACGLVALLSTACQRTIEIEPCVEQTYVHKYGVDVDPDYWYQSGRNGQVITTMRDGVVVTQTFANGMLNGESTYSFSHSELIQRRETYDNDVLTTQILYTSSGVPYQYLEYTTPEIYTMTIWYENGHPKSIEKYERGLLIHGEYYNTQNHKDSWVYNGIGERNSRDDDGHVVSIDTYRGGELAMKTTKYPNNTPKEIICYANGVIHGDRKTFYSGGDPMAIETWTDGQQNGTTIIFQNGEKYAEIPYLSGKKNGIERRYRDGSVLTQEITWYNDQMHGPTFTYVGDSVQTDWFYRGRLTTRSNFESFAMPKNRR